MNSSGITRNLSCFKIILSNTFKQVIIRVWFYSMHWIEIYLLCLILDLSELLEVYEVVCYTKIVVEEAFSIIFLCSSQNSHNSSFAAKSKGRKQYLQKKLFRCLHFYHKGLHIFQSMASILHNLFLYGTWLMTPIKKL